MIKRSLFLFFIAVAGINSASAQTWEIGLTAGGMGYMGDLNQTNFHKINHPAFGGMIKRNFDSYWSLKFSLLSGKVSAADSLSKYAYDRARNLSFYSPLTEASLQLEFNFFDYGFDFLQKHVTPFIYSGVSTFTFNPKTDLNGTTYELRNYATEGQDADHTYKSFAYAIPVGAGAKINFGHYFNLIAEAGFRTAFTDYLDDVSTVYPLIEKDPNSPQYSYLRASLADPSKNKIGVPGTQRGDFRKKDTYLFVGITLSYTFVSQKCPF